MTRTRFRVGSITKTFVAALVLQLVDDEDPPPDDRWSALPGVVPAETRSRCATCWPHVGPARLRRDAPQRRSTQALAPTELVELALAGRWPAAPPATVRVREHELRPPRDDRRGGRWTASAPPRLAAPRAARAVTDELRAGHRARAVHGHRAPSHQGVVTGQAVDIGDEPAWWTWAAGGVVSTAADVQRFFAAVLRGELLSPRSMREMATLVPAGRQRYGLGLAVFPTPCEPAWGHTGNVQGTVAVAWNTAMHRARWCSSSTATALSAELERGGT